MTYLKLLVFAVFAIFQLSSFARELEKDITVSDNDLLLSINKNIADNFYGSKSEPFKISLDVMKSAFDLLSTKDGSNVKAKLIKDNSGLVGLNSKLFVFIEAPDYLQRNRPEGNAQFLCGVIGREALSASNLGKSNSSGATKAFDLSTFLHASDYQKSRMIAECFRMLDPTLSLKPIKNKEIDVKLNDDFVKKFEEVYVAKEHKERMGMETQYRTLAECFVKKNIENANFLIDDVDVILTNSNVVNIEFKTEGGKIARAKPMTIEKLIETEIEHKEACERRAKLLPYDEIKFQKNNKCFLSQIKKQTRLQKVKDGAIKRKFGLTSKAIAPVSSGGFISQMEEKNLSLHNEKGNVISSLKIDTGMSSNILEFKNSKNIAFVDGLYKSKKLKIYNEKLDQKIADIQTTCGDKANIKEYSEGVFAVHCRSNEPGMKNESTQTEFFTLDNKNKIKKIKTVKSKSLNEESVEINGNTLVSLETSVKGSSLVKYNYLTHKEEKCTLPFSFASNIVKSFKNEKEFIGTLASGDIVSFSIDVDENGACKNFKDLGLKNKNGEKFTTSSSKLFPIRDGKILALSNNGSVALINENTGVAQTRLVKDPRNVFGGKAEFRLSPIKLANDKYTAIFDANIDGGVTVIDDDGEVVDRLKDNEIGANGLSMLANGTLVGSDSFQGISLYKGFDNKDEKPILEKEISCDVKKSNVQLPQSVLTKPASAPSANVAK